MANTRKWIAINREYEKANRDLALARSILLKIADKKSHRAIVFRQEIKDAAVKCNTLKRQLHNKILSDGCMKTLTEYYASVKYGKKTFSTGDMKVQLQKGLEVEPAAIEMLGRLDDAYYVKNKEVIKNKFLSGVPDILLSDRIIDVKASFDIRNFFSNLISPLPKTNWWQMQGYMNITGFKEAEVAYCLITTPYHLLNRAYGPNFNPDDYNYDDIPETDRRLRFIIHRDEAAMKEIGPQVKACRKFLVDLEKRHKEKVLATHDPEDQTDTDTPASEPE
jgi:hypothetical protein